MMLHVPQVLSKAAVADIRQQLDQHTAWIDGQHSAGPQAKKSKHNLQFDPQHPVYLALAEQIEQALRQHPLVQSATLAKHILRPMFNCYQQQGSYGNHVDSAVHYSAAHQQLIRTDVSMTLFLSEPEEYQGGELVIEDTYGAHEVKLDAGDVILYPATSLHRVEPVTAGRRIAAFTWAQSMIRDDWQRSMLFNLDMTIGQLRQQLGDNEQMLKLTAHYHNLLRQWGEL
ncbi:Fe2+-dependent dioxygenase [Acinetobacter sp. YH12134]|uniref:Fe2+-dependent dioxygenase n=1 Tax=Acinetobacter sp. YH12134 TaxID=2601118 RepID=UPI0015D2D10C|nr:Fe2+-dependent dioxygenase [Acinetobacter sp. YH12134]